MKRFSLKTTCAALLMLLTVSTFAQEDKSKRVSPPAQAKETTEDGVTITIDYSAPNVKGREVWGTLVEYDKVWRTGANEATTFEVNKDVMIEGHKLAKGKYALFTIIPKDGGEVTVILNKVANQWGAFKYKESEDALRFKVKERKAEVSVEAMLFTVSKSGEVNFNWEKLHFDFHVKAAK
jgi:hypothetical protein